MLPLDDIQGTLLRLYDLRFARFIFLRFEDAAKGRDWLRNVSDSVTSVSGWDAKPAWTFNVALSFSGLQALGQAPKTLGSFPEDFRVGMAARSKTLGDTGPNDPLHWLFGADSQALHALVAIYAEREDELERRYAWHKAMLQSAASEVFDLPAGLLDGATEHFGYRDGFGQPDVKDSGLCAYRGQGTPQQDGSWKPLATGEFVLGYDGETGGQEPMPNPDVLGRNGSYIVVRMLRQNVAAFRSCLQRGAEKLGCHPEWLAAKMVGRWRSGAPLTLARDRDDEALGANLELNNDFRYKGDEEGLVCPHNAHIRRVNARDGMDGNPNVDVSRHRILRRGMPYGSVLPEGAPDDGERGILFLAVNASISRQFEFIQRFWVNSGDFLDGSQEKDPVVGNHDAGATFTIPARPANMRVTGLSSFVETRGGGYFFLPGITALRYLSRNPSV